MNSFKFNKRSLVLTMGLGLAMSNAEAIQHANGKALIDASTLSISAHQLGFERIASFPVYLNTDINSETVAEIVAASADGNTLIYTDGETENVGFVDITNPAQPQAGGVIAVDGGPTSVSVSGDHALVFLL